MHEGTRNIDPITKLPSQLIFIDRVDQAMAYSVRNKNMMAVAILNVDKFSRIKDTMGSEVGDELLREIGQDRKSVV